MGEDPTASVTDPVGRFHDVPNAYAAGPALFPTVGSPKALDALVEPGTRGDPMRRCAGRRSRRGTLADVLTADGHPVSHVRVGELLHGLGYSLQSNAKAR